ncbi:MAG TPA: SDR family oxidoreductase [Gammaproteobacteria bacterium]|nr:SDR family oxidoreductase [Gammaproteobacteria bacterium]
MRRLDGKIAIVTGASSGIGEATALQLAEEGATVVVAARRADRLVSLVERIDSAGGKAEAMSVDMAVGEQIERLAQAVRRKYGRIDILVNNAGVMLLAPALTAQLEEWRRMVEINLLGLLHMSRAVLPIMQEQGGGHIVNLSSLAGRLAMPGGSVYSATKFGVNAFSEALRKETVKDRIRVTLIEPGPVATELHEHITDPGARQRFDEMARSVEQLRPEDVAEAIVYAVTRPARVNVNEILITPTEYVR